MDVLRTLQGMIHVIARLVSTEFLSIFLNAPQIITWKYSHNIIVFTSLVTQDIIAKPIDHYGTRCAKY